MNVFYKVEEIIKKKNTILTVGTFDGVHLGHQKLLNEVRYHATDRGARSLVITFEPHPRKVLENESGFLLLTSLTEKIEFIERMGIQNLLIIPFTREFSNIEFQDFVIKYLVEKTGVAEIILGPDHHFGKDRLGNSRTVLELGKIHDFKIIQINEFISSGKSDHGKKEKISSSSIRKDIAEGNVENAALYLGRKYNITGTVTEGRKFGRVLGYPTANIEVDDKEKLIPGNGVYFVETTLDNNKIYGMMNIGKRPTFSDENLLYMEVHLFDFNMDIYEKKLNIKFIAKIRDEKKFNGTSELQMQLEKDKEFCLNKIKN